MRKIKFYSFALSPFALKVQSYLLFLDVDFETEFVDPMKARSIIPVGTTIPVLTIDGESRNNSSDLGFWLDDLYPEKHLVPEQLKDKIVAVDNWVTRQLINHAFRESVGFDDSMIAKFKKRWRLSKVLDLTSPNGISTIFRILHMLFIEQSFIKGHINSTDKSRPLSELKLELANQFENLLEGGPFLCGSNHPTLADLSAYPQIVKTEVVNGEDYFLPGQCVLDWVKNMEQSVPNLLQCFPEVIKHTK